MKKMNIYEPICAATTGVCGVGVDPRTYLRISGA